MGLIKLKDSTVENEKNVKEQTGLLAFQEKNLNQSAKTKSGEDPAILYEDEAKADENTRHYILNNGTSKTVISAKAVNYFDEEEKKWIEIDNFLEEKQDAFETKGGKLNIRIFKVHKGKKVAISRFDKQVSLEYISGQELATVNGQVQTVLKVNNDKKDAVKHTHASAGYENIERATDLEYCLQGNNLKAHIIARERSGQYRYLFALQTEGLKLRLSSDKQSLELYSEAEKEDDIVEQKVEFTIPSLYMYDANGIESDDVYCELEQCKNGNHKFEVVASEEWINTPERAFPVTIDSQIIVGQNDFITKRTYRREACKDNISRELTYGVWKQTSTANIKVGGSSACEYMTNLKIKRSLINIPTDDIVSVSLVLKPVSLFSGELYCNSQKIFYNTENGNLKIDITSQFTNNTNDFNVILMPKTCVDMEFYAAEPVPTLEIEIWAAESIFPTRKTYDLAGVATGEVNLLTGEAVTIFNDVQETKSLLGLSIVHVHKASDDELHVGKNFRLNLHEKLIKNSIGYIYTDAKGEVHGFHRYHYYMDKEGKKRYITVAKQDVKIDGEGKLSYDDKQIFVEYKSQAGLKAITQPEDYLNHSVQETQIAQEMEYYQSMLDDFVVIDKMELSYHLLANYLKSKDGFHFFLQGVQGGSYYVMTKAELSKYKILRAQDTTVCEEQWEVEAGYIQISSNTYVEQIKEYYKQYADLKAELDKCQLQTPINYLTDEKYIKGYNKYGDLVAVYDRCGNSVLIEYERYDVINQETKRIARVYDKHGASVEFTYNAKKQLSCITDVTGKKVTYTYDDAGYLKEAIYDTGKHIVFDYDVNGEIKAITDKKGQLKGTIIKAQENDGVSTLTLVNEVLAPVIATGVEPTVPNTSIVSSEYKLTFYQNNFFSMDKVLVSNDHQREKYVFGSDKNLKEYYLEESGLVVKAEQYEYEGYWNGNMPQTNPRMVKRQADKDGLYKKSLENYTFEEAIE